MRARQTLVVLSKDVEQKLLISPDSALLFAEILPVFILRDRHRYQGVLGIFPPEFFILSVDHGGMIIVFLARRNYGGGGLTRTYPLDTTWALYCKFTIFYLVFNQ